MPIETHTAALDSHQTQFENHLIPNYESVEETMCV